MFAREVCARCNGGWMSALEQATKPILLGLMQAVADEATTTLQPDEAALVAVWAIKTAWMREFTRPGRHTATAGMRNELRCSLQPPAFSTVWIAEHRGQMEFDARQAQIGITRTDRWDDADIRTAQFTALTFRGLCLLCYTVDGQGVGPPTEHPGQWLPLWPITGAVTFPPAAFVGDVDVSLTVAQQTPWLALPSGLGFKRASDGPKVVRRN